ncbi:MAG: PLP-dependent transferase, partial [Acidimicrobiales bacterium]|nr:PLP-dependent transferase [Acidimicrobiales bacterium]
MNRSQPDSPWPGDSYRAATEVVHLGRPARTPGGPVNAPVVLSSTFHQGGDLVYGRDGNPTWDALEEAIGGLEGGRALAFASGLAAISAVVESLPMPGRVVVAGDAYSGTRRLLSDLAGRGRLRFRVADVTDVEATLRACGELCDGPARGSPVALGSADLGCRGLLWLESPTNPLLDIADLPALISGAHALGMDAVVDNTFASPLLQRPLDMGADV